MQPFPDELKDIADNMGVALYQCFTLNEASLFLRCPVADLQALVKKRDIQFIQVSRTKVQFFGYQLVQHLLNNVVGNAPQAKVQPAPDSTDRILRAHEVHQISGLSRTTIWRMENKGQFPRRLPLSTGSAGWRKSEINAWVRTRK